MLFTLASLGKLAHQRHDKRAVIVLLVPVKQLAKLSEYTAIVAAHLSVTGVSSESLFKLDLSYV